MIKKIVKLTVLFGLVLGVAGQAKAGWYNYSWNYRKEITIDGLKVPAARKQRFKPGCCIKIEGKREWENLDLS